MNYTVNEHGDTIETHGDGIVLNHAYWECKCDDAYIRPVTDTVCANCDYHIDDCPSAYEEDVQRFIYTTQTV
jgi:hypothetical protein